MKKDFAETLVNIHQTNELMNQEEIKAINYEENKKYGLYFFKFISLLYPLLKQEDKNQNSQEIPHFG